MATGSHPSGRSQDSASAGLERPRAAPALLVVIPVYNDWESVARLLPLVDRALAGTPGVELLLIDDCSTDPAAPDLGAGLAGTGAVHVLRLRRNLGHQRAIAVGLTYASVTFQPSRVLLMDGDGEDQPSDIPALLAASDGHPASIVFASRRKRSESLAFRLGYLGYRLLHRVTTGMGVNVGNFSVIPGSALRQLVVVSHLWSHYAAAVFNARIPHRTVPTTRGARLAGQGKMNFPALATHGLSALAVHSEIVGTRLMLMSGLGVVAGLLGLAGIVFVKLATDRAIPGWATTAAGITAICLIQMVSLSVLFAFTALAGRSDGNFIPLRDYAFFVDGVRTLPARPRDG